MITFRNGRAVTPDAAKSAFASDGTPFDAGSDIWKFRTLSGAVNIDFTLLQECAPESFVSAAKKSMKLLVETRNLQSVRATYLQFRHLVIVAHQRRDLPVDEIDAEDIALWCARGNAAYIGQLRPIIETWSTLKQSGIAQEARDFLAQVRVLGATDKESVRTFSTSWVQRRDCAASAN